MPHEFDLILTLTGCLTAALIFGMGTQRLGLSPIVGYLIAGMSVSPFTPGFVAHEGIAEQLAEVGVILLMFGVGLHFQLRELLAVRRVAIPGALVQITVAVLLGVFVGNAFGWNLSSGLVFGLAISVASTVVLLRVLTDAKVLHTPVGHLAVGWLVIEDIFTVLVLVVLPEMFGRDAQPGLVPTVFALGRAMVKIAVLIAFTFVVGKRAIPALLGYVAKTRSRELFTLTVLVLALGIAVGSAVLFGASMALGAFLAGMVVGQSHYSYRAAAEALPMRDAFAVLFFVSVGMLFNPAELPATLGLTLATLAVVLIGKPLAAIGVVALLGGRLSTGLSVGAALAQIGEFSFIVSSVGMQLGVMPRPAAQALVAASIVSITLNPLFFRIVKPFSKWLARRQQLTNLRGSEAPNHDDAPHAIVVGYGPIGQTVARLLRENGVTPTIIELNDETVKALVAQGTSAVYGDASLPEVLKAAGIKRATAVVSTAASENDEAIIRVAKELNPKVEVLARTNYLAQGAGLREAGADIVISGEGAVALSIIEHVVTKLGVGHEQVARERERVKADLQV